MSRLPLLPPPESMDPFREERIRSWVSCLHQVGIKTDILDILKHLCDAWILVESCNSKIYSESENDLVDNVKDLGATVVLEFLQRSPSLFPGSLKNKTFGNVPWIPSIVSRHQDNGSSKRRPVVHLFVTSDFQIRHFQQHFMCTNRWLYSINIHIIDSHVYFICHHSLVYSWRWPFAFQGITWAAITGAVPSVGCWTRKLNLGF